jgi:hypothetical protein
MTVGTVKILDKEKTLLWLETYHMWVFKELLTIFKTILAACYGLKLNH